MAGDKAVSTIVLLARRWLAARNAASSRQRRRVRSRFLYRISSSPLLGGLLSKERSLVFLKEGTRASHRWYDWRPVFSDLQVIHCGVPGDVDTYIHRSGRTGRAGRAGKSLVLVSPQETRDLERLEHSCGFK